MKVVETQAPQDVMLGQTLRPSPWEPHRFRQMGIIQEAARNHGRVELAEDSVTGCLVAMKVMPLSWVCESHEEFAQVHPEENELPWRDIAASHYLSKVVCLTNICDYVGLYRRETDTKGKEEIMLVLTYCAGGDLFSWLERSLTLSSTGLDRERATQSVMIHVLKAVADVHRLGVAHGDLSLENVLLADAEVQSPEAIRVRLIDFGASTGARASGSRGKPSYQAPEVHLAGDYDALLADAFSLGVMIFTLVVGNYPWRSTRKGLCPCFRFVVDRGLQPYLQRRKLKRPDGAIVTLAEMLSAPVVSLLSGLLAVNPYHRLSVASAINHPWFTQGVSSTEARAFEPAAETAAGEGYPGSAEAEPQRTADGAMSPAAADPQQHVSTVTHGTNGT